MASEVDVTLPVEGQPMLAEDVRDNMVIIAQEISDLQDAVAALPTGGIEEAPEDDTLYGRMNAAWVQVPTGGGGGDLTPPVTITGDADLGTQGAPFVVQ